LLETVHKGDTILVSDGKLSLSVKEIYKDHLVGICMNDAEIGSRKNMNIPGKNIELPFMDEKDINDIKFGCKHNMDMIAASFVRRPKDLHQLKELV